MGASPVTVSFAGERFEVPSDRPDGVTFGRGADLDVDSNRFLHRQVGRIIETEGAWWIENLSSWTHIRVSAGGASTLLIAGGRIALAHETTLVEFEAGPCRYELEVELAGAPTLPAPPEAPQDATATHRPTGLPLTEEQRLLVAILAEPRLRSGAGRGDLPSNQDAARRLGWSKTKYNRKLDWLCARLHREGVPGMRASGRRANERRVHLVDHLLATGTVTIADLTLLDAHLDRVAAAG